jgi:predicted membrane protein
MNKPMFWVGIAIIVIAAILLLTVKEDLGIWPITMGIIGIVFIGASKYRPMKQKK